MIRVKHFLPLVGAVIFAFAGTHANADTLGRHPLYVHARSDLRTAEFIARGSEDPNVNRCLHQADMEINRAVQEIDRAAIMDRKDMDDHPPIDTQLDRNGRFRRVMDLLQKARTDIGREEDNPSAVGWRNLAYRHIDRAMEFVRRAARDLQIDRDLGW